MSPQKLILPYFICFFLKASLLSWFFIPRWEIPDESAHFSYIVDIADEARMPVLGEAKIHEFIYEDLEFPVEDREINWIVQHPPLYYTLMVPVYLICDWTGQSMEVTVHWIRTVNSLIASLFLFVSFLFCWELVGRPSFAAVAGVACLGAVPMLTNVAAGINNSMLLALLLTLGFWLSLRYIGERQPGQLYLASLCMGLACITKYTALPVVAVWGTLMALKGGVWKSKDEFCSFLIAGFICLLPVGIWCLRNQITLGELLPLFPEAPSPNAIDISFLEFVQKYGLLERYFRGFFCQIGWIGLPGDGVASVMDMPGQMRLFYYGIFVICGFGVFIKTVMPVDKLYPLSLGFRICFPLLLSIAGIHMLEINSNIWSRVGFVLWFASLLILLIELLADPKARNSTEKCVQLGAGLLLLSFLFPLMAKSFELTLNSGHMRAIWGRYFFPFSALLLASFLIPALSLIRRLGYWVLLLPASMQIAEVWFWFSHVAPFYQR